MDSETHTDSVLAKLMRLSRPRPQLPLRARQRVLSESYLQNIASLTKLVSAGHLENKPFEEDDSTMDVDWQQETKDSFEELQSPSSIKHHILPITEEIAKSSVSKDLDVGQKLQDADIADDRISRLFGASARGSTLNKNSGEIATGSASFKSEKMKSSQKVKPRSFAYAQVNVSSSSTTLKLECSHSETKKDDFKPRRVHKALDSGNFLRVEKTLSTACSSSGNWRHGSSSLRSKRIYPEPGEKKSFRVNGKSRREIAKQVTNEVKYSAWYQYSSISGSYFKNIENTADECGKLKHGESKNQPSRTFILNPLNLSPTGKNRRFTMHRDWELKLAGRKLQESVVLREDSFIQECGSGRRQSVPSRPLDSEYINLDRETSSDTNILEAQHLLEGISVIRPSGYASACSVIEILSDNENWQSSQHIQRRIHGSDLSGKASALSKQRMNSSSAMDVDVINVDDVENEELGLSLECRMDQRYELCSPIYGDGDSTPDYFSAPRQKFRDDALMPSHFAETEKVCSLNSVKCYDISPDSVLESEELFQDAGSTELKQLELQEQLLYFSNEPYESNSEGHSMMVSSDEESDDGFLRDKHIGDEEMMKIAGTHESRDFSYVVDVLSDSGHELLSMDALDPHVFDVLEEKYGKQTSWTTSDRRLLFDRIKSSFMKMLGSCMSPSTRSSPVAKRFISSYNLDDIVEELWTSLINEERKLGSESSDKVIGKEEGWLGLGEETELIVKEIEEGLTDELVSEAIGVETR